VKPRAWPTSSHRAPSRSRRAELAPPARSTGGPPVGRRSRLLVRRDAQALAETERGEAVQRLAPAGREGEACSQVVPMCRHPARCRLCHRNNGGTTRAGCARLWQPCGFSPSHLDHRDLGVSILPQHQEIAVGAFRLHGIARERERSRQLQARHGVHRIRTPRSRPAQVPRSN